MLVNIPKDPTTISIITLISSFMFFALILYLFQPKFIQIIDKNGNSYRSKQLIISFSATFAFVFAITSLLLQSTKYREIQQPGNTGKTTSDFNFSKLNSNFSL